MRDPRALRAAAVAVLVWLAHWASAAVPVLHAGPVTIPGFAAAADTVLLAVLAGVVWFMVISPHRPRAPAPGGAR